MPAFPLWLHGLATVSIALGVVSAAVVAVAVVRQPPRMAVMAFVWPLTALFGGPLWLAAYRVRGRGGDGNPRFAVSVFKGSSHCGAGCTLADILVEWAAFAVPAIAVAFGWQSWFDERMFAVWIPDYLVAFLIGIAFQYFAIAPMRHLSPGAGIVAAVKADAASITAWQVGMYGGMAALQFGWFRPAYGGVAPVDSPEFWFAMQLAMLAGFATSYPVNWWLIRAGLKEAM